MAARTSAYPLNLSGVPQAIAIQLSVLAIFCGLVLERGIDGLFPLVVI
jgi:hypothetical protein